ncbi:MAG: (d)CMP kinase [Fimbriimonadaceae bacterium]|nr:(d)CMP kinase [Fimbriimonadaceae bacterium]
MRAPLIAMDGPAGAGKSTVARILASKTGLAVLDTGAMYRCVALAASQAGIKATDVQALAKLAGQISIEFQGDDRRIVILDSIDVTSTIRTLEVGQLASKISENPAVRRVLVAQQQSVIEDGGYILEGRDVTTVVAPHADVLVFLTASIEERARRRWAEVKEQPEAPTLPMVVKDVVARDYRDYSRLDSPLMLAENAVIIESFGLTPDQVAQRIESLLPARPR